MLNKALFFPQNKTHIDNMLPVAERLHSEGFKVIFLNAQKIYKQYIFPEIFPFKIIEMDLKPQLAFSFLSSFKKILFLMHFVKYVRLSQLNSFDLFIYGNDGALQRVFISKFKNKKHILILDGMISDYTFSFKNLLKNSDNIIIDIKIFIIDRMKYILNKCFAYIPYNYYLPSDVGCSRLDKIFVLSDYINNVIRNQRLRSTKIITSGMPRYKFLKKDDSKESDIRKMTFITGAYVWHNDIFADKLQHKTISVLINNIKNNQLNDFELTIRVHPREDINNYKYLLDYNFIKVEDSSVNIYDTIRQSDVIIAPNSTVMLEAMFIDKKVIFLFFNNEYWRFSKSYIKDSIFKKVFNEEEFLAELIKKEDGSVSKEKLKFYFNPNSEKAVDIIVNEIIKND